MKKVGKLMEELGFNKKGPDAVKKAFIKHLIQEAHYQDRKRGDKNTLRVIEESSESESCEQLSLFNTGTDN